MLTFSLATLLMTTAVEPSLLSPDSKPSSLLTNAEPSALESVKRSNKKPQPVSSTKGYYVGFFGGGGGSNDFQVTQRGTALYPASVGGPLPVQAKGSVENKSMGLVGAHVGYEFSNTSIYNWNFTQAVEIEGYYVSTKKEGMLINFDVTGRLAEHDFKDKFPINMGVMLLNWIWASNQKRFWNISPYIGIGVGASVMSIHHANSAQISPPEPGINHFNSNPNDTDWTFAVQGKAGVRFPFFKYLRFFAEYRFLYQTSSDFTFGSVKYPTHVPSLKWRVHFDGICNNMFALGLDFPW
jgi:hypothetical protein